MFDCWRVFHMKHKNSVHMRYLSDMYVSNSVMVRCVWNLGYTAWMATWDGKLRMTSETSNFGLLHFQTNLYTPPQINHWISHRTVDSWFCVPGHAQGATPSFCTAKRPIYRKPFSVQFVLNVIFFRSNLKFAGQLHRFFKLNCPGFPGIKPSHWSKDAGQTPHSQWGAFAADCQRLRIGHQDDYVAIDREQVTLARSPLRHASSSFCVMIVVEWE